TATPGLAMAQYYTLRDESVYHCCPPASTGERKQFGVVAADDVTKKSSFNTMQALLSGAAPPAPNPAPAQSPVASPTPAASPAPSAAPAPAPAPPPAPTATTGGLHVQGNQMVDSHGTV